MSSKTASINPPATSVKGGHTPQWLIKIIKTDKPGKEYGKKPWLVGDSLREFFAKVGVGLDHSGSTVWHGIQSFVTEPYGVKQEAVARLKERGRELGFGVFYSADTYHPPGGGCERVLLFPTDLSISTNYHEDVLNALREAGCEVQGKRLLPQKITVLKNSKEETNDFKQALGEAERSDREFLARPVFIENRRGTYILCCQQKLNSRLKALLRSSQKMAKERGRSHPKIEIETISNNQVIYVSSGICVGNEGTVIQAFEHKSIPQKRTDNVEKAFLEKLQGLVLRTTRGPIDGEGWQHLVFELERPISVKAFHELYSELADSLKNSGHNRGLYEGNIGWKSVSRFMLETLDESTDKCRCTCVFWLQG